MVTWAELLPVFIIFLGAIIGVAAAYFQWMLGKTFLAKRVVNEV
jgi:hypothetical protein